MKSKFMVGLWRYVLKFPPVLWEKQISKGIKKFEDNNRFLTPEHRMIHHFVVRELPFFGKPIPPDHIADRSGLSIERVKTILDDLESHMTFIYRNPQGEVEWAYPVTVEQTPHKVRFHSGEHLYAAWAADAIATPFVQGRLRNEMIKVVVTTECAHCSRPMEIKIDSGLQYRVTEQGCEPIVFVPDVDLTKLEEDSIIESFWRESVFFWSEEHAKEHRKKVHRIRGAYLTTDQMIMGTRIIQSAIFGFDSHES